MLFDFHPGTSYQSSAGKERSAPNAVALRRNHMKSCSNRVLREGIKPSPTKEPSDHTPRVAVGAGFTPARS